GQVRQFRPRRRSLVITKAAITDDSGVLQVVWYNQPYLARLLAPGRRLVLHGRVQRRAGEIQMIAPEFEPLDDGEDTLHVGRIVPVYPSTDGLSQRVLRTIVFHALDDYAALVEEWLPARVRRRPCCPIPPGPGVPPHAGATPRHQRDRRGSGRAAPDEPPAPGGCRIRKDGRRGERTPPVRRWRSSRRADGPDRDPRGTALSHVPRPPGSARGDRGPPRRGAGTRRAGGRAPEDPGWNRGHRHRDPRADRRGRGVPPARARGGRRAAPV